MELTALNGSEKQIKWANDIRNDLLEFLSSPEGEQWIAAGIAERSRAAKVNPDNAMAQSSLGAILKFKDRLFAKNQAKFWIDRRNILNLDAKNLDAESGNTLYNLNGTLVSYSRWAAKVQAS